jgi:MFS family permease
VDLGGVALTLVLGLAGFMMGFQMPSRDLIVRAVTPPGSFGKVFGFVTTGFHIGGMVAPLIFAQMLDHGHPRAVFLYIAACAIVAIATVTFGMSGRRTA